MEILPLLCVSMFCYVFAMFLYVLNSVLCFHRIFLGRMLGGTGGSSGQVFATF